MRRALPALLVLLLSGCTSAGLWLANLPLHFNDVTVVRNTSYGARPDQTLDLYLPPAKAGQQPAPVLVFVYGGSWQEGSKESYAFVGNAFAQRGYIVAIADYRKYPAVRFPAFVDDIAAATAWVYKNVASYGGNPEALFLAGHSAGAQIAALVATDPRYLRAYNLSSHQVVRGFAGLAGPYDFTPEAPDIKAIFPPETYHDMKVTNFVDGTQPPMLLLSGERDETVAAYNYQRLASRIGQMGGKVEVKTYPGIDHVWIAAALTWFGASRAPVAEDMARFFAAIK